MEVGCHGYALTDRHCSCDLYSWPADQKGAKETLLKLRRKYEKRGWSEAKIQRALNDPSAYIKPNKIGLRADVRMLIADIVDEAGRVEFFVHFYSGDQMTEKLTVNRGATVSSGEIRSGAHLLEPDVLTTVVARKGRR